MSDVRIGSRGQDSASTYDRSREDPDAITVCLVGAALLLALGLGVQKWFVAARYAVIMKDFGVEPPELTKMVVLSPRVLAIPVTLTGIAVSFLGLFSRKAGLVVVTVLVVANIVMFGAMSWIEMKLNEELSMVETTRG
ncbi:hypothetical protein AYO47_05110 [Planctomyces sp. SCGC AG-212-M04]|nr:hypothetical protein AYO47_05110 [Planctomyces sp. SCGC AG-212-M04]